MNTIKTLFLVSASAVLTNCGSDDEVTNTLVVPATFTVNIPDAISSNSAGLAGRTDGDGDGFIEGNEIYESLRGFLYVAEEAAGIIDFVLEVAAELEEADLRTFEFTSDVDGRQKRIDITEDFVSAGNSFQYELRMVDVENEDLALQLLWSANPVVIGIGIMNPYQIERIEDNNPDTFIRIDYGDLVFGYDAVMQVQISGLEVVENGDIDNMTLFVGRKGELIDVVGNSNHPNLILLDDTFIGGRSYAFIGRGDEISNFGVVKLALPPSGATTSDFFETHSVFSVLEREIQSVGISDQSLIDDILQEAHSPAYFNANGFITSGEDNKPDGFTNFFVDLSDLETFVPADIRELKVNFIQ